MSGGSLDYGYSKINMLADDIEAMFINDGKYFDDDYSNESYFSFNKKQKEYDRLGDCNEEQRSLILSEVKSLLIELRKVSNRAKELEYFLSGDTGPQSYLERLKNL